MSLTGCDYTGNPGVSDTASGRKKTGLRVSKALPRTFIFDELQGEEGAEIEKGLDREIEEDIEENGGSGGGVGRVSESQQQQQQKYPVQPIKREDVKQRPWRQRQQRSLEEDEEVPGEAAAAGGQQQGQQKGKQRLTVSFSSTVHLGSSAKGGTSRSNSRSWSNLTRVKTNLHQSWSELVSIYNDGSNAVSLHSASAAAAASGASPLTRALTTTGSSPLSNRSASTGSTTHVITASGYSFASHRSVGSSLGSGRLAVAGNRSALPHVSSNNSLARGPDTMPMRRAMQSSASVPNLTRLGSNNGRSGLAREPSPGLSPSLGGQSSQLSTPTSAVLTYENSPHGSLGNGDGRRQRSSLTRALEEDDDEEEEEVTVREGVGASEGPATGATGLGAGQSLANQQATPGMSPPLPEAGSRGLVRTTAVVGKIWNHLGPGKPWQKNLKEQRERVAAMGTFHRDLLQQTADSHSRSIERLRELGQQMPYGGLGEGHLGMGVSGRMGSAIERGDQFSRRVSLVSGRRMEHVVSEPLSVLNRPGLE
ncbi:unnamed protein product [Closterium sp. NIES-53]